jgi:hypothetical protein
MVSGRPRNGLFRSDLPSSNESKNLGENQGMVSKVKGRNRRRVI